jgi:plasmid stabilization system protein ParE
VAVVVFWSIPARDDLKGIHDYIARDSKRYAARVTQDIRDKAKMLIDFPPFGKSIAEIGEENVREIHLYSYRIMYEIMPEIIYIHGVIHMRRNFKSENFER